MCSKKIFLLVFTALTRNFVKFPLLAKEGWTGQWFSTGQNLIPGRGGWGEPHGDYIQIEKDIIRDKFPEGNNHPGPEVNLAWFRKQ